MSPVSTCASCLDQACRTPARNRPALPHQATSGGSVLQGPDSIARYRGEEDRHKALLAGQATTPRTTSETKRDLQKWEAEWQKLGQSGGK